MRGELSSLQNDNFITYDSNNNVDRKEGEGF